MSKIDWTAEPRVSLEGEIDRLATLVEEQRAEIERLRTNLDYEKTHHQNAHEAWVDRAEAAEQEIGRLKIRNGELASEVLTGALPILKKLESAERALAEAVFMFRDKAESKAICDYMKDPSKKVKIEDYLPEIVLDWEKLLSGTPETKSLEDF